MIKFKVFQGDTTDIVYVRPGPLNKGDVIDVNWICKVAVNNSKGANVIKSRIVSDKATVAIKNKDGTTTDEECFMCYLTPTETADLKKDTVQSRHNWIIQVSNAVTTPPFSKEEHYELKVNKQGIS